MKNELFKFWAGGWKAYAEEEKKNVTVGVPTTFVGRMLKFGRSILGSFDGSIDKRLF